MNKKQKTIKGVKVNPIMKEPIEKHTHPLAFKNLTVWPQRELSTSLTKVTQPSNGQILFIQHLRGNQSLSLNKNMLHFYWIKHFHKMFTMTSPVIKLRVMNVIGGYWLNRSSLSTQGDFAEIEKNKSTCLHRHTTPWILPMPLKQTNPNAKTSLPLKTIGQSQTSPLRP